MKILSVKGENLLSLGEFELHFDDSGLILVEGWNFDDGRANGAGKTAIFNLLCLALYQKIPRKVTMSEIVKRGEKRGYVEATVLAGGDTYTLVYGRPKRRVIKKNGVETTITQDEMESILKLSYEQFLTAMYAVQGGSDRFLNMNDTAKKEFLLQLMNLDKFTDCKKEAQKECKRIESEISTLQLQIEKAKSKIEVYSEQKKDKLMIEKLIKDVQDDIKVYNKEIIKFQQVIKPDLSKFNDIEQKIQQKYSSFAVLRSERSRLMAEYTSLSNMITDFIPSKPDAKCPACNVPLSVKNNTVAEHSDQSALKAQHDVHIQDLTNKTAGIKSEIDDIDVKLYKENEVKKLDKKIREDKQKQMSEYSEAQEQISGYNVLAERGQIAIKNWNSQLNDIAEADKKITALEQFIKHNNDKVMDNACELEIYRDIVSMYSPTGAPAYVMDSIIESFNEAVNIYTSMIWPSATYSLQSYKEGKTGDVTAKFSETLIINGQQTSIGALSGGEQRAFSLSIDFAIADILSKQFGMPLNPIIMDEPFEGLDAIGRETVIELLEKLSVMRQIWVIDHASEAKSMFSKIMKVEKKNGTSYIVD